jgi:hypothetical protein
MFVLSPLVSSGTSFSTKKALVNSITEQELFRSKWMRTMTRNILETVYAIGFNIKRHGI